jgi:signal peptidase I
MVIQKSRKWLSVGAFAAALFGTGSLYQPTVVIGNSMAPTLESGRLIWVDRTYYRLHRPQRGEVVVFRLDGVTYVKRVYRAPGEILHYLATGADWLGPVQEGQERATGRRYVRRGARIRMKQMQVPQDSVFVLGDNYLASEDSRQLGPIPISSILGRAHLPVDETATLPYEYAPRSVRTRFRKVQAAPGSAFTPGPSTRPHSSG